MEFRCFLIVMLTAVATWMMPVSAAAQMTSAFGPKQYTRAAGPPQAYTETFQHCGSGQQCQIVVVNGNGDGSSRITAASISLNGVQILGAGDFNRQTPRIVKPVLLADNNQLTITIASQPGSFFTVDVECSTSPVELSAGAPGESLSQTLLTALPIVNHGTAAAENVTARAIALNGGRLATPSVPFNLGPIAAGRSVVLHAGFNGTFSPRAPEVLSVNGTYSVGAATYCFVLSVALAVPPAAPGSGSVGQTSVAPNSVSGGRFPHQPLNFPDSVNTPRWTVPIAGMTTFETNPGGLRVSIDGGTAEATPFTLALSPGQHAITTETIQSGPKGTRYLFTGWSDGGAASHQIKEGAAATYTATFAYEYLLTTSVSPAGGGIISVTPPSSDLSGYYERGTKVTVSARPSPSYVFKGFEGALRGPANPQTITFTEPALVIANFTVDQIDAVLPFEPAVDRKSPSFELEQGSQTGTGTRVK